MNTQPTSQDITVFDRVLLQQRRGRMQDECGFLFTEIAARLNERLNVIRKKLPVVLDLGCGNGALTAFLQERAGTEIVISADMSFDVLGQTVALDAEFLPFAPESLDGVVSCLDLQWVNDLPGALLQIHQALKPDGVFLAALAGGETLKELRACLMEAELKVTGGVSPRVSPFADMQDIGALLQRAGFALPVVDSDRVTVEYDDMFRLMYDLRGMGAANVTFNRLKKPTRRAVFMEAAKIYQEKFGTVEGRIVATFDIIYAIGWAPHESQQQPLRRGSAKHRMAEALDAVEKVIS